MIKILISLILILNFGLLALAQDVRLKIVEQPVPELPQRHGTLDVQGIVVLRVQFLDFGEVGDVSAVKELPAGLTQNAIAAARRIKFEPEKDGKPVTVYREIKYSYSWNGGWTATPSKAEVASNSPADLAKAEAIIARAVQNLGGDRYRQVKTQIGRGKFSVIRDSTVGSFQSFVDVIVYPDKEFTDFKGGGSRTVQANIGDTGWIFDGDQGVIKVQTAAQIANFRQGLRTSLDNLLRGGWRGEATLGYVGKRVASLGRRNDVLRLTYKDGYAVEFEFASDDGMPQKAIYNRVTADGEEIREEDRYAQFIEVNGVRAAFIVDRFTEGKASSRINFETIEFNKIIPESIFAKPSSVKEAKKDIKL